MVTGVLTDSACTDVLTAHILHSDTKYLSISQYSAWKVWSI